MNFGAATIPLGDAEQPIRDVISLSVANDPLEDLDEVIDLIGRKEATCWLISEGTKLVGVVVTELLKTRTGKQCFIRHCAGEDIKNWFHYLETIETWARSEGCDSIEMIGRPGWERMLGWRKQAVVLRKAL